MGKSQHFDEQTDANILKRKNESLRKENELLRRQCLELKSQVEIITVRGSTANSGHFDSEKSPLGSRSVTIKRDMNA